MADFMGSPVESDQYINEFGHQKIALGIAADTGLRLKPVQYKRKARAAGNALINSLIKLAPKLLALHSC
jgi:hypothetical protein